MNIPNPPPIWPILVMDIRYEQDLVQARQRARQIAAQLHYDLQELTRIATAVSELVRYAFKKGGYTRVTFALTEKKFRVSVWGKFPSTPGMNEKWGDQNLSNDAKSLGLIGAKKLMDEFSIMTDSEGAELSLSKSLPLSFPAINASILEELARLLEDYRVQDPYDEIKQQNRELIYALNTLKNQQLEMEQLNRELAETNQGVLALYAELEDKAISLQKASEAKSLFFSNMTHEFRTPLHSAISLVRMLLERQDGELSQEQERQVIYIRKSIEDLSQMVNDLLDIAKVESGKIIIRSMPFSIQDLFSALRGMFRPLVAEKSKLSLVFDDVTHLPPLISDESKVGQILRNFISNALKNTEAGEIHVSAHSIEEKHILISVRDTGIGIAHEDRERIFEEFVQLDNLKYQENHGTGLGLPLSKRLAYLLGGRIILESEVGRGSAFSLILPGKRGQNAPRNEITRREYLLKEAAHQAIYSKSISQKPWLIIDKNEIRRYLLTDFLQSHGYGVIETARGGQGLELARNRLPAGIFLDGLIADVKGLEIMEHLKNDPLTRSIPVIISIPKDIPLEDLARLGSLATAVVKKEREGEEPQHLDEIRKAMRRIESRSAIGHEQIS